MNKIDLNADIGESFGSYKLGYDEEIVKYISSANIATGFHAGDHNWIKKTVDLSKKYNVAIGAHPSYPDLAGFGRREMSMSSDEIENLIKYQVGALIGFVGIENIEHVKPHGALYNKAVNDSVTAKAIINAIKSISDKLIHVVLAGSLWEKIALDSGVKVSRETFADREFMSDGTLCPRSIDGSVIEDSEKIVNRTLKMIKDKEVDTFEGDKIKIDFDSICLHGDTEGAVEIARSINNSFQKNNIIITSMSNVIL
ncbi:MAG: lactam utilization protein LamB [Chloroflexi bacterium]|nr:lactam utilization protein LamB [Chloroflexota bacterium]|tara:strand:+ start:54799 stop:55563 length:765 start_codon:yes stop_codon:yes gene_type:complete